jgi:hypothetical protein
MGVADLLQTISLVVVAITLALSARQNRHLARQTRETVHQSILARSALSRSTQQELIDQGTDYLGVLLTVDQPALLTWFLASRGIPPAPDEINRRYLFMFLRMDVHETTYLAHLDRALPEDVWIGWRHVIALDSATDEFRVVWPVVRPAYSARFASFVDELMASSAAGSVELSRAAVDVQQKVP